MYEASHESTMAQRESEMIKATFSVHKQIPKCSNDYLIYYLDIVHHFHDDLSY